MYRDGEGMAADIVRAYQWFSLAAIAGDEQAASEKNSIELRLPAEGLTQAQAWVRVWQAQHQ
jgi:localization factor PodJL